MNRTLAKCAVFILGIIGLEIVASLQFDGQASISIQDPLKSYAKLKKKIDGAYYYTTQSLHFQYLEQYSVPTGANLNYCIYNHKKEMVSNVPTLNVSFGENFYSINLANLSITANEYYTLEVTDSKGEKWYMRFYYSSPPPPP